MKGAENPYDQLNNTLLTECGLNMQATFSVRELPLVIREQIIPLLEQDAEAGSLLLLGNGGKAFWQALTPAVWDSREPLDCHSIEMARAYLHQVFPGRRYRVLYPSTEPVGLQQLGRLAGWHGDSPLKLGINPVFGLWYAYRALLWVEGALPASNPPTFQSPCLQCAEKRCIQSCPADALSEEPKYLQACIDFRLAAKSPCQFNCLARLQCPVALQHQYSDEQIRYHYTQSFETLVRWRNAGSLE